MKILFKVLKGKSRRFWIEARHEKVPYAKAHEGLKDRIRLPGSWKSGKKGIFLDI